MDYTSWILALLGLACAASIALVFSYLVGAGIANFFHRKRAIRQHQKPDDPLPAGERVGARGRTAHRLKAERSLSLLEPPDRCRIDDTRFAN